MVGVGDWEEGWWGGEEGLEAAGGEGVVSVFFWGGEGLGKRRVW